MRKPSPDPLPKEKGPSLFLWLMIITGYVLLGYASFNVLVNPILGLNWEITAEDSEIALPMDWEGALSFVALGLVWTLFWRFWAWKPVRKWMRAHVLAGVLIGVGLVGLMVLGIWLVERKTRMEEVKFRKNLDSLRAIGELPEDPGELAIRMREALVVMSNPTLDSLAFCVNDSIYRWIEPMELAGQRLAPGRYRLAGAVRVSSRSGQVTAMDTLDAVNLVVSEGKSIRDDLFIFFNVKGAMSFALLDYRKAWGKGGFRENARDKDFHLLGTSFGERFLEATYPSARLTLPHHSTQVVFDNDEMLLKLVVIPPEWKGQTDKIKRYAIWSLKLEESRGMLQDFTKTVFMPENERRAWIRDRLKRETAEFEAGER
jgi:hypothetical protein